MKFLTLLLLPFLFGCSPDGKDSQSELIPYEDPFKGDVYNFNEILMKIEGVWVDREKSTRVSISPKGFFKFECNGGDEKIKILDEYNGFLEESMVFEFSGNLYNLSWIPDERDMINLMYRNLNIEKWNKVILYKKK